MPGSLLSNLLGWAASHLVALTLFGFVLAGLAVFGVIELPGERTAGWAGGPAESMPRAPRESKPKPVASAETAARERGPDIDDRPVGRKVPKLIGGSLPVYQQPPFAAPATESAAAGSASAFRPPTEAPPATNLEMTRGDLVQQARRAYWSGDFEAAEGGYMTLIAAYPDDADAFGELGNLYQSMGKPAAARDAYYEAAVRLRAAGEKEKLNHVVELLTAEGDERAAQLSQ